MDLELTWIQKDRLESLLMILADEFALAIEAPTEYDRHLDQTIPTDAGLRWAMRQPVAFGAVLLDLAERLGVPAPQCVRQALGAVGSAELVAD